MVRNRAMHEIEKSVKSNALDGLFCMKEYAMDIICVRASILSPNNIESIGQANLKSYRQQLRERVNNHFAAYCIVNI